MKKFIVAVLSTVLFVIGCGTNNAKNPTVVSEKVWPDPDQLPPNWFAVKGDGVWSYGLPVEFTSTHNRTNSNNVWNDRPILAEHTSASKHITIRLSKELSKQANTVMDSVFADPQVIVISKKHKLSMHLGIINAIYYIKAGISEYYDYLEFFVQKNSDVYRLSCYSERGFSLTQNSSTCFDVIDTLRLK
jgi:hypothetical protein